MLWAPYNHDSESCHKHGKDSMAVRIQRTTTRNGAPRLLFYSKYWVANQTPWPIQLQASNGDHTVTFPPARRSGGAGIRTSSGGLMEGVGGEGIYKMFDPGHNLVRCRVGEGGGITGWSSHEVNLDQVGTLIASNYYHIWTYKPRFYSLDSWIRWGSQASSSSSKKIKARLRVALWSGYIVSRSIFAMGMARGTERQRWLSFGPVTEYATTATALSSSAR